MKSRKIRALATITFASAIIGLLPIGYAHCPLCTATTGAAVVAARFYGIDDSVVGIWIGAFVVSTALWLSIKLKKKYLPFQNYFFVLIAFLLTATPFYSAGLISTPIRELGRGKLLLGMIIGAVVMLISSYIGDKIKKRIIPFQKILICLAVLTLASIATMVITSGVTLTNEVIISVKDMIAWTAIVSITLLALSIIARQPKITKKVHKLLKKLSCCV